MSGRVAHHNPELKLPPAERALALQKKVEEATGIQMPKYYNPSALNPIKYAEQMQKRKLLWSKPKDGKTESQWKSTALSMDNSTSNKFQKLMGMKSNEQDSATSLASSSKQQQDKLFDQLNKEYEFARM